MAAAAELEKPAMLGSLKSDADPNDAPRRLIVRLELTSRMLQVMDRRSWHVQIQLDHVSIDGKPSVSMVMDGFCIFLGRVDPRFDDLHDEEIVFLHKPRVGHSAFKIGEAPGHERGWGGGGGQPLTRACGGRGTHSPVERSAAKLSLALLTMQAMSGSGKPPSCVRTSP